MSRRKRTCGIPSGERIGPGRDIHLVQPGELLPPVPDVLVVGRVVALDAALVALVASSGAAPGVVPRMDGTTRVECPGCGERVGCRRRFALTPWSTLVRGPATASRVPDEPARCNETTSDGDERRVGTCTGTHARARG